MKRTNSATKRKLVDKKPTLTQMVAAHVATISKQKDIIDFLSKARMVQSGEIDKLQEMLKEVVGERGRLGFLLSQKSEDCHTYEKKIEDLNLQVIALEQDWSNLQRKQSDEYDYTKRMHSKVLVAHTEERTRMMNENGSLYSKYLWVLSIAIILSLPYLVLGSKWLLVHFGVLSH